MPTLSTFLLPCVITLVCLGNSFSFQFGSFWVNTLSSASSRRIETGNSQIRLEAITPDGGETDLAAFRQQLIDQMNREKENSEEFNGYDFFDLIQEKWSVPYDIRLKKEQFAGKPMLYLNVMWRYLGQKSFPFTEQEYLEHLEALAQLLIKWERVDHVKEKIAECRKRPQAYFGYAVSIPLDLPADELITIMPELFE
mmetsp:Transcript_32237/g.42512  ORF Transcript_32237/g.42512 Transcript_32237/m.42512 type:complete len:197 (+) Transcript_32237:97-687(+)